ncbi:MAG: Thiol peroxidase, Bcp-type (EC [uncultured Campylobacterales bacterium]|uniref:Putative peroxiredoxin bcp n=1 Tax=uncultured Campylobacterales bacterium TaxID=352960 RepID=A0A6S6SYR1_9BACT|nr:MAG: Thiol peroxidase, Bcp-type (EC [uncultured Campylobacterales bacterium]
MIEVGQKIENFTLKNQDNIEVSLNDFKGKWIVVYFYPKDNTPGCTTQACDFTAGIDDFYDEDTVILGISPDSVKKHQNFIAKQNLKITLLSDEEKEVLNTFGVWQLKKLYGREYMGVVRTTYLINPDFEVAYRWDNVRVKEHSNKVLEKIKELKA